MTCDELRRRMEDDGYRLDDPADVAAMVRHLRACPHCEEYVHKQKFINPVPPETNRQLEDIAERMVAHLIGAGLLPDKLPDKEKP